MLDGYIVPALKTFSLRILKIFSYLLTVIKKKFDTNLFGIKLHKSSFLSESLQSFVTIFALLKFHDTMSRSFVHTQIHYSEDSCIFSTIVTFSLIIFW